ncbi:MAG: hypothetical protein HY362_02750 [Candidatus Aenigmarchaeota archaeon]|nr:hypothetical protein [Candidatus Aenigmarchaeota archaeon]
MEFGKDSVVAVLSPSHGHAPYLVGAEIGRRIGEIARKENPALQYGVLIPLFYPGTQEGIMERRLEPSGLDNIYMSRELGEHLLPVMQNKQGYPDYLERLTRDGEKTQKAFQEKLKKPVKAVSLGTGEEVVVQPESMKFELMTWMQFATGLPAYSTCSFVFPEFARRVADVADNGYEGRIIQLPVGVTSEKLREAAAIFDKTRGANSYRKVFLPRIHTLSFVNGREPHVNEVKTPPLKSKMPRDLSPLPNFIYANMSGAGYGEQELLKRLEDFKRTGIDIAFPDTFAETARKIGGRILPESVMSNPACLGTAGRAGWGTIWEAYVNTPGKRFFPAKCTDGDFEITFNEWSLEREPASTDPEGGISLMQAYETDLKMFGIDGIDYVAEIIAKEEGLA